MSNDTKQIEALRDAAQVEKDFQETKHTDAANTLWLAACHTISNCDRAIAALRAADAEAEEPDAAASKDHGIASAEQAQQQAVSDAIGTTEYLDPPDGGDVPLSEQVRRMRAELARVNEVLTKQARPGP